MPEIDKVAVGVGILLGTVTTFTFLGLGAALWRFALWGVC